MRRFVPNAFHYTSMNLSTYITTEGFNCWNCHELGGSLIFFLSIRLPRCRGLANHRQSSINFVYFFFVEITIFLIICKFKVLRFEFNILIISYNVDFLQLDGYIRKCDPGLTDIKVPAWQQLGVQMLINGRPKAYIGNDNISSLYFNTVLIKVG